MDRPGGGGTPWRRLVLAGVLMIALVSCAGLGSTSSPQGPGGTGAAAVNCRALAKLGVKPCPPADPTLATPKLVNDTGGAVSNSRFHEMARAFLRNWGYETYALANDQPNLLKAGILSTSSGWHEVYGPDLKTVDQARSIDGHVVFNGAILTEMRLVQVPSSVQSDIVKVGLKPDPLAFIATVHGPEQLDIASTDHFTVLTSVSSKIPPIQDFYWGTYQSSTDLGPVFRLDGLTNCSASQAWQPVCES